MRNAGTCAGACDSNACEQGGGECVQGEHEACRTALERVIQTLVNACCEASTGCRPREPRMDPGWASLRGPAAPCWSPGEDPP